LYITLACCTARAQERDDRAGAAALFERGVKEFEHKDYAAAARTFLKVDESMPSARALVNALSAARRAGLYLAVTEVADRAGTRADLDDEARKLIEAAMTDATPHLARLDVRCRPEPCTVTRNGRVEPAGPRYAEPGDYVFVADAAGKTRQAPLHCAAGATCSLDLLVPEPVFAEATPPASAPRDEPQPIPATPPRRPLTPPVFLVGAAVTVGLVALTTWSGLDTLSARRLHDSDPEAYDPDTVHHRAQRTDVFLAGSVLVGAATAIAGVFFVDWGHGARTSLVPMGDHGAAVTASGRF
jgi:hypothetical protein